MQVTCLKHYRNQYVHGLLDRVAALVFTKQNGEDGIEVRVHDEDVWLTQKSMVQIFDCPTDNISLHLKNIRWNLGRKLFFHTFRPSLS